MIFYHKPFNQASNEKIRNLKKSGKFGKSDRECKKVPDNRSDNKIQSFEVTM